MTNAFHEPYEIDFNFFKLWRTFALLISYLYRVSLNNTKYPDKVFVIWDMIWPTGFRDDYYDDIIYTRAVPSSHNHRRSGTPYIIYNVLRMHFIWSVLCTSTFMSFSFLFLYHFHYNNFFLFVSNPFGCIGVTRVTNSYEIST